MVGVDKCAILVLAAICAATALPIERKKRTLMPQFSVQVMNTGPPCTTKTRMGDEIRVHIEIYASYARQGYSNQTSQIFTANQFKLGESDVPGLDERLLDMCPGDIRDVYITLPYGLGHYGIMYKIELVSIVDESSGQRFPPEMDTDGDNAPNQEEFETTTLQLSAQVMRTGPPCTTKTKMGDVIRVLIKMFRSLGYGNQEGLIFVAYQITLGESGVPGLDESLLDMCPGDVRDVYLTLPSGPGGYGMMYKIKLDSIVDEGLGQRSPPETDTDADNALNGE